MGCFISFRNYKKLIRLTDVLISNDWVQISIKDSLNMDIKIPIPHFPHGH